MSDISIKFGNQQGWECPKCGRVYAPFITQCMYCGNVEPYYYSSPTNSPIKDSTEKTISEVEHEQ